MVGWKSSWNEGSPVRAPRSRKELSDAKDGLCGCRPAGGADDCPRGNAGLLLRRRRRLNKISFSDASNEKLGFNATGTLGYDFIGPMVEIEGAYRRNGVSSADLNQYTGMLNGLYEFNATAKWTFHVGVGIGFDYLTGSGGASGNSTNLAVQALIGMRYKFSTNYFLRTDFKAMNVFGSNGDLQNYGGTIMLGVKF